MLITPGAPTRSYDMACRHLHFPTGTAGGMQCVLEPGKRSAFHRHHENEIFVITRGRGCLLVDGVESARFAAGDTLSMSAFAGHQLCNLSDSEPLEFIALYWEEASAAPQDPLPAQVLIFSTPPTPNGDLHLGHLSGPYLGADIHRRYLIQKGVKALHVSGRDDNQTYVKRIASAERRSPAQVADDYARRICTTWQRAGIALDFFGSPESTPAYGDRLTRMLARLRERGAIVEKTVEELYDTDTGFSLHEGYLKGRCPHCNCSCDGNACEQCGRPNDCIDLREARPTMAGVTMGRRTLRKLYFRMSSVAPQLASLVARSNMSTRARALSEGMLADGLPDICISHRSDWGIPVGLPGYEGQVLYCWFEMAAGYLAADAAVCGKPFLSNPEAAVVHFYGFDNTYYHTLLFPAIYYALDEGLLPPASHVINELLFLDGEKFSTSRRHLIWGRKLLDHVPADYVRWGLARSRPELGNDDFDLTRFIDETNSFFAGDLQRWLEHSLAVLDARFARVVPEPGAWSHQHLAFQERTRQLFEACEHAYKASSFSPRTATRCLEQVVDAASQFLAVQARHEDLQTLRDHHRTTVALNFRTMAQFARLARPIVPEAAQRILDWLGIESETAIVGAGNFLTHGRELSAAIVPSFAPVSHDIREVVTCVD